MGAFEDVHGATSPSAFSDALKAACDDRYGHAARAFPRRLLGNPDEAFAEARCLMTAFVTRVCPQGADGQIERAAKCSAIVAAAGEIAAQWGIPLWPDGTAMETVARMFREWLDRRGTGGSLESAKALEQVRSMIERHGASRFVPWCPAEMPPMPSLPVRHAPLAVTGDRGGWSLTSSRSTRRTLQLPQQLRFARYARRDMPQAEVRAWTANDGGWKGDAFTELPSRSTPRMRTSPCAVSSLRPALDGGTVCFPSADRLGALRNCSGRLRLMSRL